MTVVIEALNKKFKTASPQTIINYVLSMASNPIVTTNFGPYSASLLHALSQEYKEIPVLWADSGYNMSATYRFAQQLEQQLDLNLFVYAPRRTRAFLDHHFGDYMASEEGHQQFTEIVKIEPLQRAFAQQQPDVWFTNIRKSQTPFRATLDIFSLSPSGLLKVSPFFNYSDQELEAYLKQHNLPNEIVYFDPTKVVKNKECGLHLTAIV